MDDMDDLLERLADHLDGFHGECHCRREIDNFPSSASALKVERLAVIGAARLFLAAHDRVIGSEIVTRDDSFAMKNAADRLRVVLREYDEAGQ